MDYSKRAVEHYRDHELVCQARPGPQGWTYSIMVVTHDGDHSITQTEAATEHYRSEIDALRAGIQHARVLVDESLKDG